MLLPLMLIAQTGRIAGKVTAASTKEGLEGVAIQIADSQQGVYTKANGTFIMKDVAEGTHTLQLQRIGFIPQEITVTVRKDITEVVNVELKTSAIRIEGHRVSANRAVKRETPIAFTNIDEEAITNKNTTEDIPQLLDEVPGLFANTTGFGDAEITMRGFEADKIQVLINGIPVNDPESQKVYWSNWTGLATNVKSVQVQKGAGSSLYGSGAFGGSLNIETMGAKAHKSLTVRTSYSGYQTDGDVADGKGDIISYNPYVYNLVMRYNSGPLNDGKFNWNLMLERKVGDYYIEGTNYRGYSFGLETQHALGSHKLTTNLIGSPQEHNQVYFKSDRKLMDTLGREYNRNNHAYQENYYFKPQFSLRDEWTMAENQSMVTNLFVTKGDGGGKYLNQDKFDINTGALYFRDDFLDSDDPAAYEHTEYAQHALYLWENYGVEMQGFCPVDTVLIGGVIPVVGPSYNGELISGQGYDFFRSRYDYSWRNNSISDHFQMGMNTYYDYDINPMINLVCGGELRSWHANHIGKRENFRHYNPAFPDSVETFDTFQKTYDYTTDVLNMSAFARMQYKPLPNLNIMVDGQIARYSSSVEENPIELYDLATGTPLGVSFYSTKNITEVVGQDTLLKFTDDDYQKVYSFFSPKFGVNYNLSQYFNLRANYSIAYKEPRTGDWYSGYDGPDGNQLYTKNVVKQDDQGMYYNEDEEHFYGELDPEKINTVEFGIGYQGEIFEIDANYYISDYTDKIERVSIPVSEEYYYAQEDSIGIREYDASLTLNAGQARHQGLELSTSMDWMNIDANGSLTLSTNRWTEMNVDIFDDVPAEDMVDKIVPFSPEKMASGSLGYTFGNMPLDGKLRLGLNARYWDDYYANYTNEYYSNYVLNTSGEYEADSTSVKSSKLPYFFELGADVKYSFNLPGVKAFIKMGFNNITNRENYSSANVRSDYNRGYFNEDGEFVDDYLTGNETMYVTPAPLFNYFMTMEVRF
jgi:outer membrane receptor protein involved in Fe transport